MLPGRDDVIGRMIETPRLILRLHDVADFPAYHAMNTDPAVMTYIGGGRPMTEEESWNRFLRNAGFWPMLGFGLFAVIEKASGDYAGHVGLGSFHRGLGDDFDPCPEAAWALVSAAQGKGYATEGVLAAHDWLRRQRGPLRTVCIIDAQNEPSLRVAGRLGYRAYGEAMYKEKRVIKFERLP